MGAIAAKALSRMHRQGLMAGDGRRGNLKRRFDSDNTFA